MFSNSTYSYNATLIYQIYVCHSRSQAKSFSEEGKGKQGRKKGSWEERKGKGKRLGDDETFHFHVLYNRGIICIFELENDKDPAV
jgi:hypothetical protein